MIKIKQIRKQIVAGRTYIKAKKVVDSTYSALVPILEVNNGAALLKRIEVTYAQYNMRTQLWLNHTKKSNLNLDYYNGGNVL